MTAEVDTKLVAMRLIDMAVIHPSQDNSRVCEKCGEVVGIYPSGQRALKKHPGAGVICVVCAVKEPPPSEVRPAGSFGEIAEEIRMSREVREA